MEGQEGGREGQERGRGESRGEGAEGAGAPLRGHARHAQHGGPATKEDPEFTDMGKGPKNREHVTWKI